MKDKVTIFFINYFTWGILGYAVLFYFWMLIYHADTNLFLTENIADPNFRTIKIIFLAYLIALFFILSFTKIIDKSLKTIKIIWLLILMLVFGLFLPHLKIFTLFNTPWLQWDWITKYAEYFQIFFLAVVLSLLTTALTQRITWQPKINWGKVLPWFAFGIGVFLYGLHAYFDHTSFETHIKDVSLFDQIVWNFSRFRGPETSILKIPIAWGDHFHPILALLAPLYWIWDNVLILLFAQAVIVSSAVFPIYNLAKERLKTDWAGFCFALSYLLFMGLQCALDFGFYPEILAVALFAWLIYFFYRKKNWQYLLFLLLFLACKENLSLYVVALGIYFLLTKEYRWGIFNIIIGLLWYKISIGLIIPHYAESGYKYLYYAQLGDNPAEIIKTIITNPLYVLNIFTTPDTKMQTLLFTFASVGFLIYHPFFIVLIPNLGERLLSSHEIPWMIGMHYIGMNAAILIILAIFSAEYLINKRFKNIKQAVVFLPTLVLVSVILIDWSLDAPFLSNFKRAEFRQFKENAVTQEAIQQIPKDENISVSAQNTIGTHLAHRRELYLYPEKKDTDFIILSTQYSTYPINTKNYAKELKNLLEDKNYGIYFSKQHAIVFKRNYQSPQPASPEIQDFLRSMGLD